MANNMKTQQDILEKLNINVLNPHAGGSGFCH